MTAWVWIWDIRACEGGDLGALIAKAQQHGVGVLVKVHDGESDAPNGVLGFQLIDACWRSRVPVRSWGYCYPNADPSAQADFAHRSLAVGASCYIADAEVEYEGHPDAATALAQRLPAGSGYSPLPIVDLHGAYPYREFNALARVLPQAYAGTGGRNGVDALLWSEDNWRRWSATWQAEGGPLPALEWAIYGADQPPADLGAAAALAIDPTHLGGPDFSVWSWQHLTAAHWIELDASVKTLAAQEKEAPTDMESLQRVAGHLVAPFVRSGSTLHLANPTGNAINVSAVKTVQPDHTFAAGFTVAPWAHQPVAITADGGPLFVEDGGQALVAALEVGKH